MPYTSEMFARDRDLAGFSYRELERETGITYSRLCRHERGQVVLRAEQLDKVQRALHSAIRERAARMTSMLAATG
jgi:transcriptional regulator with XRE-family HTH domain